MGSLCLHHHYSHFVEALLKIWKSICDVLLHKERNINLAHEISDGIMLYNDVSD